MMGALEVREDVPEGLVGGVGDVDEHAESVHLVDDLVAEGGEAGVIWPGSVSPEEAAQSLELDQVRVMARTPRRW